MNEHLGLLDGFDIRSWETYKAYYRYDLNREEKPASRSLLTFLNLISADSKKLKEGICQSSSYHRSVLVAWKNLEDDDKKDTQWMRHIDVPVALGLIVNVPEVEQKILLTAMRSRGDWKKQLIKTMETAGVTDIAWNSVPLEWLEQSVLALQ